MSMYLITISYNPVRGYTAINARHKIGILLLTEIGNKIWCKNVIYLPMSEDSCGIKFYFNL